MIRHIDLGTTPGVRLRRLAQFRRDGLVTLGGNRNLKIYGTLTCRSGRRLKVENRVFFRDEAEAVANGYRPCGHCLREAYALNLGVARKSCTEVGYFTKTFQITADNLQSAVEKI